MYSLNECVVHIQYAFLHKNKTENERDKGASEWFFCVLDEEFWLERIKNLARNLRDPL